MVMVMALGQFAQAQDDVAYTQYWTVPNYYNAAAIGSTDFIRLRGGIVPYLKHYTAKSRLFPYRMRQCRKINSIRAEIDKIKPCECCK